MFVKKIAGVDVKDIASIERALSEIETKRIANCNWPDQFPYAPEVALRLFHTGKYFVIRFDVREKYTMAHVTEDHGEVWTDSCCELFFQPRGEGKYYNLEATCIGKILLSHRPGRQDAVPGPKEALDAVLRYPSIGTEPFDERVGDNSWSLTLAVPATSLFADSYKTWDGVSGRFNSFKCGDKLSVPHFLSLAPITTEKPDFHRPEFFIPIEFE